MREPFPVHGANAAQREDERIHRYGWERLKVAIERYGGTVSVIPSGTAKGTTLQQIANERDPMFVRDTGLFLPHGSNGRHYFSEPTRWAGVNEENDTARRHVAERNGHTELLPGYFEGGNLVYDAHRNTLFWGVNNYDYLNYLDEEALAQDQLEGEGKPRDFPMADPVQERARKFDIKQIESMPAGQALARAYERFVGKAHTQHGGKPFRIVPMFIPDAVSQECYHLDNALGILPTGEAVYCPAVLSQTARKAIEKHIEPSMRIPISRDELEHGAANFITVGHHLITPFCGPRLRARLEQAGYSIVDPATMGMPEGFWEFAPGGFVRCATLKTTPDAGYPAPVPARSPLVAAER